uniref:Uncharacterized protein n=1 Tax=Arundo donax TaxID=35708 RepID=A0A0A9EF60_ARUDO
MWKAPQIHHLQPPTLRHQRYRLPSQTLELFRYFSSQNHRPVMQQLVHL